MERGSVSYSVRAFVPMKTLLIIENIKVLSLLKKYWLNLLLTSFDLIKSTPSRTTLRQSPPFPLSDLSRPTG